MHVAGHDDNLEVRYRRIAQNVQLQVPLFLEPRGSVGFLLLDFGCDGVNDGLCGIWRRRLQRQVGYGTWASAQQAFSFAT